jgi:tRNA threonylcarbamoyladenosine biosynthesis protein TsaB
MLILAVDTSTRQGSLAVLRDEELLGEVALALDNPHSTGLFQSLEALLGRLKISLNQLDLFAVSAGPGSFTGLRVGLTAVKAWAEVLGKPIAAVSSLEAIATQVSPGPSVNAGSEDVVVVLDARRGQIFGGIYRRAGNGLALLGQEVLLDMNEFLQVVMQESEGRVAVFATPTPALIEAAVERSPLRGARTVETSAVLARYVGMLGYRQARRGKVLNALELDANYVRRSDAEVKWKDSKLPAETNKA